MMEIDLHGFKHEEVEDKLANLLILFCETLTQGLLPVTFPTYFLSSSIDSNPDLSGIFISRKITSKCLLL